MSCYITINRHNRLLKYTLLERATFLLYNDIKPMSKRNKYFKLSVLKDRWGKTTGTFSRNCEPCIVSFMCCKFITAGHILFIF